MILTFDLLLYFPVIPVIGSSNKRLLEQDERPKSCHENRRDDAFLPRNCLDINQRQE